MSKKEIDSGISRDELLAKDIEDDFSRRQAERRGLERGWQLNMKFVSGNQYCDINSAGEIEEEEKRYFWQTRRVYNYIAPVVDTRISKLGKIRPALSVRAASDDESDKQSARLSSSILAAISHDADLDSVISDATIWSETCGTAFYKVVWNFGGGATVAVDGDGKKIKQGDVKVAAVSPFEIYPYSLSEEKIENQPSIIHAKALPVQDIYAMYGVKLCGREIEEFSLSPYSVSANSGAQQDKVTAKRHGYEIVIERYSRPSAEYPEGRLSVAAGGKLLYDGNLPYVNGIDGARGYPFIKQTSLQLAGSFFGGSVVDRLIPVQRAYNAVKCRKHEFLNRISMGTVAVEDGSVDVDELSEDGLMPGKIIVYRQGGKPPEMLTLGSVPTEFSKEEECLQTEFSKISGTGDLTRNADSFSGVTSATGLQLIIDQNDARLDNSYQQIKRAMREIGRHILRLYRQFASDLRLLKYAGESGALSLLYFKGGDITSDDVVLEADSDSNLSPAQRRAVIYEMLDRNLFSDENGNLSVSSKNKILNILGYAGFSDGRDLDKLQKMRADEENTAMKTGDLSVNEYDNHILHVTEHTAFLLTEKLSKAEEGRICAHIHMHRQKIKEEENGQS